MIHEVTLIYDTCNILNTAVTIKQGLLFFPDEVSLFYDTLIILFILKMNEQHANNDYYP